MRHSWLQPGRYMIVNRLLLLDLAVFLNCITVLLEYSLSLHVNTGVIGAVFGLIGPHASEYGCPEFSHDSLANTNATHDEPAQPHL